MSEFYFQIIRNRKMSKNDFTYVPITYNLQPVYYTKL